MKKGFVLSAFLQKTACTFTLISQNKRFMFNKADAEVYFNAEKQAGLLFVVIALVAIITALFLFFYFKNPVGRGVAIPLLVIGLMQGVVGYTVYSRTDQQRKDIVYKMDMNKDALEKEEIPRMQAVMKQFTVLRYAEIGLLLTGIFLYAFFQKQPHRLWWAGIGLGIIIQAGISLVADGFAEKRAKLYLHGLQTYLHKTDTR